VLQAQQVVCNTMNVCVNGTTFRVKALFLCERAPVTSMQV